METSFGQGNAVGTIQNDEDEDDGDDDSSVPHNGG